MYGSLDISTSGLVAQRARLTVASANLMNANTLLDVDGNYAPYRRQQVILGAGDPTAGQLEGVHVAGIVSDPSPLRAVSEPHSPYADAGGYVYYPNVDPVAEQMNAMEAMRAYEANISAVEATKSMMQAALRLLG
jgi:flagellar basal-body rod protein FlgC